MANGHIIRHIFTDTLTIGVGYIPLGMAFALLMQQHAMPWYYTWAMSVLIFGGSVQFVAVSILAVHGSLWTLALATILLNLRHIIYDLVIADRLQQVKGLKKYYIAFGLTDEPFSVLMASNALHHTHYYIGVILMAHIYWIIGTTMGLLISYELANQLTFLQFSLTALFFVLLLNGLSIKRDMVYSIVALVISLLFANYNSKHMLFPALLVSLVAIYLIDRWSTSQPSKSLPD